MGDNIVVTYTQQNPQKTGADDDNCGEECGFVDVFNIHGRLVQRLQHVPGTLTAPWGVALAPQDFGFFSHALLIGNRFGGTIAAFNIVDGRFLGNPLDESGKPIAIPGLWALAFDNRGSNQASPSPGPALFFAAGINGRHERMHRTLKEETTRPAALTLRLQQKKFDRFRQVFNYERPHEGLNNATPGSIYQPSLMTLPRNLIEYVYPKGFELRRVNNSGDISWHKGHVFVNEVFRFEVLAFKQFDEDFYKVYFRDVEIGEFDAEARRFRPLQVMR